MAPKKQALSVAGKPGLDPTLPRVPFTAQGKEFWLCYDFNAIALAELHTGLNLFGAFDFAQLSVTKFRAMLFASLLKENPEITLDEVGNLVTVHNLAELTIKMIEAWHGSRPEVKDEKGNAEAEASEKQ